MSTCREVVANMLRTIQIARDAWGDAAVLDDLDDDENELASEVEGSLVEAKSALRALLAKLDEKEGAK